MKATESGLKKGEEETNKQKKVLERKRARENPRSGGKEKCCAPWLGRAGGPGRKRAKSEGEGEWEEAGSERTARLPAPWSATWEVRATKQAWPNFPPGGSQPGRGHNYTPAPGEDLKTKWRGLQSGSQSLRSSEGGRARAQETFYKACGYKEKKNKPLSSSVGSENKAVF